MTKKSKATEKKLKAAAKQSKKAIQREKKGKSKAADDSDADDVDLEAVLAEYANQVRLACVNYARYDMHGG